jgi:hypothetical protein
MSQYASVQLPPFLAEPWANKRETEEKLWQQHQALAEK